MRIETLTFQRYQIPMTTGQMRRGILVNITNEAGDSSRGEIAPLPGWSHETLDEAESQLINIRPVILNREWEAHTCLTELSGLSLFPSVSFGLESALLSLLAPVSPHTILASALLMGTPQEIREQARLRLSEGYTSAKLKVSNLSFDDAAKLIDEFKDKFSLRIDVNRAWKTEDSIQFFSQFQKDAFDYVEEPFKNPQDLIKFQHPLAVDESFPHDLSLEDLEKLPMLKALIYKPTIQGGLAGCMSLQKWTRKRGISLILSSSFESNVGLRHIASIAHRLSLEKPIGIGTYHFMKEYLQ